MTRYRQLCYSHAPERCGKAKAFFTWAIFPAKTHFRSSLLAPTPSAFVVLLVTPAGEFLLPPAAPGANGRERGRTRAAVGELRPPGAAGNKAPRSRLAALGTPGSRSLCRIGWAAIIKMKYFCYYLLCPLKQTLAPVKSRTYQNACGAGELSIPPLPSPPRIGAHLALLTLKYKILRGAADASRG